MTSIIIAESSLELVPQELRRHPSVINHARKVGKHTSEILLDNSWHFAAMKGMEDELKRGRPDIIHFCLLEATSIPLFFENKIQVYVHTLDDHVISLGSSVRLPKSYHRFVGLIEKLYKEKQISSQDETLLEIKKMTFSELIDEIEPSNVYGLSTEGEKSSYEKFASIIDDDSCIVIGGFQKGDFSKILKDKIDKLFQVDSMSLEAHVVISRILYECEKTIFM